MKPNNRIGRVFLIVFFACSLSRLPATPAQQPADRYKQQLVPVIQKVMTDTGMPGFAIAVVEDQTVVYAEGFGTRSTGANDPISPRSLFHMASITKPFVATSIVQLWEKGKLDLDATVVTYLPYFRLADDR